MEKYWYKLVLSAVIFNNNNQVLLAKRSEDEDVLPGYWGIPGGKVEGEEDTEDFLEEELKREVLEEVGVEIEDIQFLESHLHAPSKKVQISFTSRIKKGDPRPLNETEKVEWFNFEEIKEMKLTPKTLERIKLALLKLGV